MRKIFLFAFAALALTACNDPKTQEKAILDDVIKIHDSVMTYDDQLMHNKMKLDTLMNIAKNEEAKARIKDLIGRLNKADSSMGNWMNKFDAVQKGKSHTEIMNYLSEQKKQVKVIDSVVKSAVTESAEYLKPFKK